METSGFKTWLVRGMWVVFAVGLFIAGYFVLRGGNTEQTSEGVSDAEDFRRENASAFLAREENGKSTAVKAGKLLSNGACEGEEKPNLVTLPMRYEDFGSIIPYGMTVDNHVTPIDHQYFSPADFSSPRDAYEVRAMADAKIVDIGERTTERGTEYRMVFSMSCKLFYYYDLVTSLAPKVQKYYDEGRRGQGRGGGLPVKAGEMIGRIGGQTLDFAVWDTDVWLTGFAVPEHYGFELWKIHTADPLNYYTEELKRQALSKYLRTAEPRSGKIDYDIDGKLVGTWFVEGSGGYMPRGMRGDTGYWKGHLSLAYDYLDPTSIVISMGEYDGREAQFGVKGNTPNPAAVDVKTGLVKYELVGQDWASSQTGARWDRASLVKGLVAQNQENQVQGTVLVQMLEPRKIKFQAFPGKTASQVFGFTEKARIFER